MTSVVYLLDHAIDLPQTDAHLSEVLPCEAHLDFTFTCVVPLERGRKSCVQAARERERPSHLSLFSALPIVFAFVTNFCENPHYASFNHLEG